MIARNIAATATIALSTILAWGSAGAADQTDEPVMLVATPELRGELYSSTVLVVTPIGKGQHIGFIINRPTPIKLSEMFPDHEPSKKVTDPIFLGGPENVEMLIALVQRQGSTNTNSIRLTSDLYVEIEREKVDRVIENEHDNARFFAGAVVWHPGELDAEIQHGYWYVQDADADLVLRKSTTGMWEELVKRIERIRNAITASNDLRHVHMPHH
jgi:putative transcriptional regulator